MSRFFSHRYRALTPYVPGEQPQDRQYIKLNTNESPYPPSAGVSAAVEAQSHSLQLYSDPECAALRAAAAALFGVRPEQLLMTNGSDEALDIAFAAFADENRPLAFPDITYGFYPVFAARHRIPFTEIPLSEDFSIDPQAYCGIRKTVVIANPNAPTGMLLPLREIEKIVQSNADGVVIVDEAYVDFGGESALPLIDRYDNLLVIQTFSKSRSMAGARLGFAVGSAALIADMNTIRYAINPYNVNSMTAAAGLAALRDNAYYMENCRRIAATREETAAALRALGFLVTDSKTNFLFAAPPRIGGEELYRRLKHRGILVRHFTLPRIAAYVRITVGTPEQMRTLIHTIQAILEE